MKRRLARLGAAVSLSAVAAVVCSATSASAAEPEKDPPHAYGAWASATVAGIKAPIGPLAESYLPDHESSKIVDIPKKNPLISAGVITSAVKDEGQTDKANASIADVGLLNSGLPGFQGISVGAIKTSCEATVDHGIKTSGEVANLNLAGQPVHVAPGQQKVLDVKLPGGLKVAKLTLNEHVKNKDGSESVNGLHLQAIKGNPVAEKLLSGDVILAHSHCAPADVDVAMASGTGAWVGFGALGVAAVPAGFWFARRRKSANQAA